MNIDNTERKHDSIIEELDSTICFIELTFVAEMYYTVSHDCRSMLFT